MDQIKVRLAAATPGPWNSMTEETSDGENVYYTVESKGAKPGDYLLDMSDTGAQGRADAEFIAHAPDDIAYLLAEVESLRSAMARAWNEGQEAGFHDVNPYGQ